VRAVLGFFGGTRRKRAREELQKQLRSIFDRLETLETTPPPSLPLGLTEESLAKVMVGISGRFDSLDARVQGVDALAATLQDKLKDYAFALSEGIERTDRAERRIRGVVARAQKKLADAGLEDPGLDAEDHQLRLVDGEGSGEGGVPDMPEAVGPDSDDAPSSVPGVTAGQLRRARGFG